MEKKAGGSRKKNFWQRHPWVKWVLIGLVVAGLGTYVYWDYTSRVYTKAVMEVGSVPLQPEDFRKERDVELRFETPEDAAAINTRKPGKHEVRIRSWLYGYTCELEIRDTVAPKAEAVPHEIYFGEKLNAEDFVTNVSDVSELSIAFIGQPDFKQIGEQPILIDVGDEGDNHTVIETVLAINPLRDYLEVESGSVALETALFVMPAVPEDQLKRIEPVTDLSAIDVTVEGNHTVVFKVGEKTFSTVVRLADTTPPVLELQPVERWLGEEVKLEDFIVRVDDVTPVAVFYAAEPDLTRPGSQPVTVRAEDASGNITMATTQLTLLADDEPPVIEGVKDLTAEVGEAVRYMEGVSAHDNHDAEVEVTVDTSAVISGEPGIYPIIYAAQDKAGNVTVLTAILTVKYHEYNEAEVNVLAQKVLDELITEPLTPYQTIEKIYYWVRNNLSYADHPNRETWVEGAYVGLTTYKGDCYVYAMTAKALLNNAGVKNDIIMTDTHVWNIVDIGEGWYHFDTTPRREGGLFFYLTDDVLMNYSRKHDNSHNYDHSKYPEVVKK